ncbi:UNVERIFIED_CONTAM: hypothetical protein K2H54_057573 [Gekko kuhli]
MRAIRKRWTICTISLLLIFYKTKEIARTEERQETQPSGIPSAGQSRGLRKREEGPGCASASSASDRAEGGAGWLDRGVHLRSVLPVGSRQIDARRLEGRRAG